MKLAEGQGKLYHKLFIQKGTCLLAPSSRCSQASKELKQGYKKYSRHEITRALNTEHRGGTQEGSLY